MFDYAKARTNMVDSQIHTAGVISPGLLQAFGAVPREIFVQADRKTLAYSDEDLPVGRGRFLMEPMIHAKLLQAADLRPDDVVLDVGCGPGYSSAILAPLVSTVVALDADAEFIEACQKNCAALDALNIVPVLGEHKRGRPENAPYSLIIVNGAVSEIPGRLVEQLSEYGRLLAVLRKDERKPGKAVIVSRNDGGQGDKTGFSSYTLFDAGTPYLSGFEPQPTFVF